jgi:putative endonuclease
MSIEDDAPQPTPARVDPRRARGRRGERLAAEHLRSRGCVILAQNVRTRQGEIDLIVRDRATLVFVEVKTRCVSARRAPLREDQLPLAGLGARQRARLRSLALAWLSEARDARRGAASIRFDAVGVVIDTRGRLRRIEHLENAW